MDGSAPNIECLICGSALHFEPGRFSTRCDTCEEDRPLPMRFAKEIGDSPGAEDGRELDALEGRTRWRCMGAGCGALLSAPGRLARCPCCGGELFEDARAAPVSKAHATLGFLLDETRALRRVREELDRLELGGSVTHIERVHLPWAVMSCEIEVEYRGQRGTIGHTKDTTHVRWEPCDGELRRPVNLVRAGLAGNPRPELIERLEPWDWVFSRPYAPAQLEASAVHVLVSPAELFNWHFPDPRKRAIQEARYDIGGDHQRVDQLDYRLLEQRFRVVMLPVWLGVMIAPGNRPGSLAFAVNGRTGEVAIEGHASAELNEDELPLQPHGRFGPPDMWIIIVMLGVIGAMVLYSLVQML